jgi:3-hydroxyacyl-[acyl-carrier-protein] dehydratase
MMGSTSHGGRDAEALLGPYDIQRIVERIPHRFPFLLVDRIVEMTRDVSVVGLKTISINEGFLQGHHPAMPTMPSGLLIEAMAQCAAVLVVETLGPEAAGRLIYFGAIDMAKFHRPVVPGDTVILHLRKVRRLQSFWKFAGEARVGDEVVVEALCSAVILDR